MDCGELKWVAPLVMLNEVKHLAHEWKAGIILHGQVSFDAQVLRSAQDDKGHMALPPRVFRTE